MGKIMSSKKKDDFQNSWATFKRYFAEHRKDDEMKTAQENFRFLSEKFFELDHIGKHELLKQKIREKIEEADKPIKPLYHGKKADQIIIDDPQKTEFNILPKTKENDPFS